MSWTSILKGEHVGESTLSPCCGDIDDLKAPAPGGDGFLKKTVFLKTFLDYSNFFVFQNYEFRFSENFYPILIR